MSDQVLKNTKENNYFIKLGAALFTVQDHPHLGIKKPHSLEIIPVNIGIM